MYLVADIGGTNTRIAASEDLASMSEPVIFETPQPYDEAIREFVAASRGILGSATLRGVAIGLPVLLDPDKRGITAATNLPLWKAKRISERLEKELGAQVTLENDVAMVGLGEAHFGAGRGARSMVYYTVSTGVNAVRIVDGVVEDGYLGASTGGQYVSMQEPYTTLEDMISGKAIQKRYGMQPRMLGKQTPVWEDLAKTFAFGLHNSILHWSPERVVLGGSMFNEIGIPVERVRLHAERIRTGAAKTPDIVHSELGDVGGLWGGLARLKQLNPAS